MYILLQLYSFIALQLHSYLIAFLLSYILALVCGCKGTYKYTYSLMQGCKWLCKEVIGFVLYTNLLRNHLFCTLNHFTYSQCKFLSLWLIKIRPLGRIFCSPEQSKLCFEARIRRVGTSKPLALAGSLKRTPKSWFLLTLNLYDLTENNSQTLDRQE